MTIIEALEAGILALGDVAEAHGPDDPTSEAKGVLFALLQVLKASEN